MTGPGSPTRLAGLGLVLVAVLSSCSPPPGEPSATAPPPSETADSGPSPVAPTLTVALPSEIPPDRKTAAERTVILRDYSFQPSTMEVAAGAEVHLTVVNGANREHAWVLMEKDYVWQEPFDADDSGHGLARITVDIQNRDVLIFTAPTVPGEYNVVCSILGHVEHGMVGTLIVR